MLENIGVGLKATGSIVTLIEKIASRILNIKNNRKKKAELKRLIKLLNETRISRTLNSGLSWYLQKAIEDYNNNIDKHEIEIAVQQIEKSISAIIMIIDRMSENNDRVVIYENTAWNELHKVVNGRKRLIDDLKQLDINKRNLDKVAKIASNYEKLTDKLDSISFELSKHGRRLDSI